MKTIYKYEVSRAEVFDIQMPRDATILHFRMQPQEKTPAMWVLCDPSKEKVTRSFRTFGTGWEIPEAESEQRIYIGTYFDNWYVWHVFEVFPID